ncbi:hypothetical protein HMPREF1248_0990 [Coriobacteriaceae bacterium BV3Ac1]|nr:hypothetical protein HMPREF1248_0990 [Coriobacteriaceae bacterium BV3Ac1]
MQSISYACIDEAVTCLCGKRLFRHALLLLHPYCAFIT